MNGRRELYVTTRGRQLLRFTMEAAGLQRRESALSGASPECGCHFGQSQIGQDDSPRAEERLIQRIALCLLDE